MFLLTKLKEKIAHAKAPKKMIASLALAGILSLSACTFTNNPTNNVNSTDPDAAVTDPNGGDTTPSTDPADSTAADQHSQIYYNIINSDYYVNLLRDYSDLENGYTQYSQIFDPIPYGFLKNEGIDIDLIKDDKIKCDSTPYMIDNSNDVYISVRAGVQSDIEYFSCYILKYKLSNSELTDFKSLHEHFSVVAPLFVQELSYNKTPTIVHSAKITAQAYNGILKSFTSSPSRSTDLFGTVWLTMDFINFSVEDQYLECYIRPSHISGSMTFPTKIVKEVDVRYAYLEPNHPLQPVATRNSTSNIMSSPFNSGIMYDDHLTEYLSLIHI